MASEVQSEHIARRVTQGLVAALVLFKFVHLSFAGVFMDEAYYWMWGQHPALSYYDHPPLNAWLLWLSSTLFGWNLLALRLPVALAFLADIFALYLLSRRIAGEAWQGQFRVTLLLFLTTPIYWMVSAAALPDHLLLTMCLFSILFFFRFFDDRAAGGPGSSRDLMLAGLFLGLAGLAKYNAAFLGAGVGLFIVLFDRALLKQKRSYVAAGLALALQAPVVIWNVGEHFASWAFILHGRHAGLAASVDGIYPLILGILIFVSPALFWPIWRFSTDRKNLVPGMGFARSTFLISTLSIVAVAFTTLVLFHWNLVGYAAMLPFLATYLKPRWLLGLQAVYGAVFAATIFVNYAIVPITDVDGWRDEASAWSYGWSDAARAVEAARATYKVGFVAAADYTTASLLGVAMRDRDVTSLSTHIDQFDYWFDVPAHAGEDAILYGDSWRPLGADISKQFASITELTTLSVDRFGRHLNTQHIYLARGFAGHG